MAKRAIKRRTALVALGAGAGALATAGVSKRLWDAAKPPPTKAVGDLTQHRPVPNPEPAVTAFFGDLRAGSKLGEYTLSAIYPVRMGAIAVVLTHAAKSFQIDLLRRDDQGPAPVGQTTSLALFLANQGNGDRETDHVQGVGALALASALSDREAAGARPPELLSLHERSRKHPRGYYSLE